MTATVTPTADPQHAGVVQTWRESPLAVKALLVGTFVNRLGGFVQIFVVLFLTDAGYGPARAAAGLGVYGAGAILGVLAGGWTSDRLGPRRTIIGSMAGTAILLPMVLYAGNYPVVLALIAAVGAISQAYRPASTSMLSSLTPAGRQMMIFAMGRLAINLGTTVAPLLGAVLLAVTYDLLFWGEAAASLLFALIAVVALPSGRSGAAETETTPPSGGEVASYRAVFADRKYLLYLLAMLASSVIYIQYVSTLPLSVRAAGMSVAVYGSLVALNGFLVICCELFVARWVQRWPARMAVVAGVALTALGMSLYGLPWGLVSLVLGTVVWTLGEIVGYPTLFFAYPAQAGPPHLRGRYLGASSSIYGLGCSIGPLAGVAVWNQLGTAMWWCCGAVGLVAVLAAWAGVTPRSSHD